MKIVNFSPIYIDGWGYQDNLLPHYFKIMGHEVCVVTPNKLPKQFNKVDKANRYYYGGVEIRRISVFCYLTFTFFFTRGLYKNLKELKPEILFHHGLGLTSLLVCGIYRIFHPKCVLFVDNHSDEINQTNSKIWLFFYTKIVLSFTANLISPYVRFYYGVSHSRCDYLEKVFKIKNNKIKLLQIGADTLAVEKIKISNHILRARYSFDDDDFVVISGGKMGRDKGTDTLIHAVEDLAKENIKIKLVLFGSINDKDTKILAAKSNFVIEIGWCDRLTTLELLKMANVAVWPIHHTTLIEDSIACLTPVILRKTRTTEHLIKGNGIFIKEGTQTELRESIIEIFKLNSSVLESNCMAMRDEIDYRNIVKTIVEDSTRQTTVI